MKTSLRYLLTALLLSGAAACVVPPACAQSAALSTNLAGYAEMGTLNGEASWAVGRHWSLHAGGRYNPFTFSGGAEGGQRQLRQRTLAVGARFWPWHIYSGWWVAGKAQAQEYNFGGFSSPQTQEGDRLGGGLTAGYSYMLGPHVNLEAGAGVWAGQDRYTVYACPSCGRTLDRGNRTFLMLNEVLLSLSYVF